MREYMPIYVYEYVYILEEEITRERERKWAGEFKGLNN